MTDLARMKELAAKATPGPWGNKGKLSDRIVNSAGKGIAEAVGYQLGPDGDAQDEANGVYIAACDPTTITALVRDAERLASENARYRICLQGIADCEGHSTTLKHANAVIKGMGQAARAALSEDAP